MPNASNTDRLREALARQAATDVDARRRCGDITATRAVLAVQGPHAREQLRDGVAEAQRRSRGSRCSAVGEWVVAGTGYTGEDGVEIHVPAASAAAAVGRAGRRRASRRPGLGARDTLRLEAGLPLHGHELGPGHHAVAGRPRLGRRAGTRATSAAGRRSKPSASAGPRRLLRGLGVRRPPTRLGTARSCSHDGAPVGVVTSGNFSPTLGHAIALRVPASRCRTRRARRGRRARQAAAGGGGQDAVRLALTEGTPRRPSSHRGRAR